MKYASVVLVYGICDESVYNRIARVPLIFIEDDGCICAYGNSHDYQSVAKRIFREFGITPMYAHDRKGFLYPLPAEW